MWQRDSQITYQDFISRVELVVYVFIILVSFLFFYLFVAQVIRGNHYWIQSEKNRLHILLERAPRGTIFDTRNEVLAESVLSYGAIFYPFFQSDIAIKETAEKLSHILSVPPQQLESSIAQSVRTGRLSELSKVLTKEQLFSIKERQDEFAGIGVSKVATRRYSDSWANSHLIGYLGEADRDFLERTSQMGYKQGNYVGKSGVEGQYDYFLRGEDGGWQIEVDVHGKQKRLYNYIAPKKGYNLKLYIDSNLQRVAYDAISQTGRPGASVAIEPKTGYVRLMVSVPGFDSNATFLHGDKTERFWKEAFSDSSLPLLNRATSGLYPPGSVFKIITMLAALMESDAYKDLRFFCSGKFDYGRRTFKCWKKEGHGRLDLEGALINSCNVYFYQLGLRIGAKNIIKYAKIFKLDKNTEIDMPHEKKGQLPAKIETLPAGESINLAIGQGPIVITPLQMAHMTAVIANRGEIFTPIILERVFTDSGETIFSNSPRKVGYIELKDEVWEHLIRSMAGVVTSGTGRACYIEGVSVAGKTGTAQNPAGQDHAWFVCFAPVEAPTLALAVVVENGGSGGAVAAPIARKILSHYFGKETAKVVVPSEGFGD